MKLLEEMLADFHKKREQAADLRRQINEAQGTATAPRKVVKVTASARGEVVAIEFPTSAFRRMTPKELAEVLQTTIAEARAEALKAVDELGVTGLPGGLRHSELLTGKADLSKLVPEEPEGPEAVREYIERWMPSGTSEK
ncbi:YbaB/EbfC family nucleoid-associated protein [Streptomyces sp. NPDC054775]